MPIKSHIGTIAGKKATRQITAYYTQTETNLETKPGEQYLMGYLMKYPTGYTYLHAQKIGNGPG